MLRTLASLALLVLLAFDFVLPSLPLTARGPESRVRQDVETPLAIGERLPPFTLHRLDGRGFTREDLVALASGGPLIVTFEQSLDWSPFSKARLLELHDAFAASPDRPIVWVMSDTQINARTRAFIGELGLEDRILFLTDPRSGLIRQLGLLEPDPALIAVGVPHPTTLVVDRTAAVRFVDVRRNVQFWLASATLSEALARLDE